MEKELKGIGIPGNGTVRSVVKLPENVIIIGHVDHSYSLCETILMAHKENKHAVIIIDDLKSHDSEEIAVLARGHGRTAKLANKVAELLAKEDEYEILQYKARRTGFDKMNEMVLITELKRAALPDYNKHQKSKKHKKRYQK